MVQKAGKAVRTHPKMQRHRFGKAHGVAGEGQLALAGLASEVTSFWRLRPMISTMIPPAAHSAANGSIAIA